MEHEDRGTVPGPRCPPAESTWPGLQSAMFHSNSADPPETHRAAERQKKKSNMK